VAPAQRFSSQAVQGPVQVLVLVLVQDL